MQFTADRKEMLHCLDLAGRASPSKSTLETLLDVLVTAGNGELTFRCTDLQVMVTAKMEAEITDPGEVSINAAQFRKVVGQLDGDEVKAKLVEKKGLLALSAGRSKINLHAHSAEDFPSLWEAPEKWTGFSAMKFKVLLDKTLGSAFRGEARDYIRGVFFVSDKGATRSVATNGYMLSVVQLEGLCEVFSEGLLVPLEPAETLLALTKRVMAFHRDEEIRVELAVSEEHFWVRLGEHSVATRIGTVEGFSNYRRVIPTKKDSWVEADQQAVLRAIGRSFLVVGSEETSRVRLLLQEGAFRIESWGAKNGMLEDSVSAESGGSDHEVVAGSKYLQEAVTHVSDGKVRFEFAEGRLSPIVIRDSEGDQYLAVVMPIDASQG